MSGTPPASTRPGPQPLKCLSHKRGWRLSPLIQPSSRTHALALSRQWRESAQLSEKIGLGMVKRQLNKSLVAVGRRDERGASREAAVESNALRVDSSCCSLLVSCVGGSRSIADFVRWRVWKPPATTTLSRCMFLNLRQSTASYLVNNKVWEACNSMAKVSVMLWDQVKATRLVLQSWGREASSVLKWQRQTVWAWQLFNLVEGLKAVGPPSKQVFYYPNRETSSFKRRPKSLAIWSRKQQGRDIQ